MQSSLIGKIEKAKLYAQEPDRINFTEFSVQFNGENDVHETRYRNGKWCCSCHFFTTWGVCSHTMALERILANMLHKELLSPQFEAAL